MGLDEKAAVKLSKFLSLVLRHQPEAVGLVLDEGGWVEVDALIAACAGDGPARVPGGPGPRGGDQQQEAVRVLRPTAAGSRASQGHSVAGRTGSGRRRRRRRCSTTARPRPPCRYLEEGLRPMSRQDVHLSADVETAVRVGSRHGRPVVLAVDAAGLAAVGPCLPAQCERRLAHRPGAPGAAAGGPSGVSPRRAGPAGHPPTGRTVTRRWHCACGSGTAPRSRSPMATSTTAPTSWSTCRVQSKPLVSFTPIQVDTALPSTLPTMPQITVSHSGSACLPGMISLRDQAQHQADDDRPQPAHVRSPPRDRAACGPVLVPSVSVRGGPYRTSGVPGPGTDRAETGIGGWPGIAPALASERRAAYRGWYRAAAL